MHAICMNPRNVDASLSYLMDNLLNDVIHAKNLSTALLMLLYDFLSSLYGLPCLGLRLFLGLISMFAFTPLRLRYSLISLASYAESPVTSLGLLLGLPLPCLTLTSSRSFMKYFESCSSPGPT